MAPAAECTLTGNDQTLAVTRTAVPALSERFRGELTLGGRRTRPTYGSLEQPDPPTRSTPETDLASVLLTHARARAGCDVDVVNDGSRNQSSPPALICGIEKLPADGEDV